MARSAAVVAAAVPAETPREAREGARARVRGRAAADKCHATREPDHLAGTPAAGPWQRTAVETAEAAVEEAGNSTNEMSRRALQVFPSFVA